MTEKLTNEQAVKEVQKFVEKYDDKKKEDWEIENDYPHVIEALKLGLLSFNEESKPFYKLKYPIKNEEGEVSVTDIDFRTRIKPNDLANVMKGLDISKNQIEYTLRCLSYITKQPKAMLDRFEKFDYKVIEQVSTVFL